MIRPADERLDLDMDRRALLAQMAPVAPGAAPGAGAVPGIAPGAGAVPGIAPGEPAPGSRAPEAPPVEPQAKPSVFQSDNKSLSGYMQEAAAHYRPEVIKLGSDAERKAAVEAYIRSLEPEMRARGWTGGEVKNEKFQENGRWKDIYRDVDGAAEAQYLDVTDDGRMGSATGSAATGMMMPGGGSSSFQGIQSLMPTDMDFNRTLQEKLQEILGGPGAMDRKALLAQMAK